MAEGLDHLKKDYRTRFCHGGGKKIDIQPGQNVLKLIQDCFESCDSELAISSPCAACCSTPVVRNQKRTSIQSQRSNAGLTDSVKRTCISSASLPASTPDTVSSQGGPHISYQKPAIPSYAADSKKTESPLSKGEAHNTLTDAEALCESPAEFADPEDDDGVLGSPLLVEEAKSSPVHTLHFDDQNTPAVVKSHVEVVSLEEPQTGRDEQALTQRTERTSMSSVRKQKSSFSSAFLAAVTAGTLGKRCKASISPPSPPVVKDQDIEIESECEFLIDESDGLSSNSWFSIPQKNKKSKKDGSATPVMKSQSSEKEKTEGKKRKTRKVQDEALTEQKTHDLDVRVQRDFKGTSQSDPVSSNGEGNGLKSQRQSSTHVGKSKKDALHQDSPRHRRTSYKPEAEQLMSSLSGLDTETSDKEKHKKRVMPSEDSPMPSAEHHEEQMPSPKENLKSPKYLQSASKAILQSVHKKHTAKQKLQESKDKLSKKWAESQRKKLKKSVKKSSNKKPQLQRGESSDSEPGEEGLERGPVKLNEMFTSPLHQKLEKSLLQKLASSEKPKNVLHALESLGGVNNKTPVKAAELLQHLIDSIQNSEKKRSLAKSSRKTLKKINHRTHKGVSSDPEDTEPQNTTDSDSSSAHEVARKKHKQLDAQIKSNKRKHNAQHRLQDSSAAVKVMSCESGPVLEHCDEFTSRSKCCEQDNESSDDSEDLHCQVKNLSDKISRHKIVMPSNTPNVRRTKRIRLKPLEYWRGERVNYTMRPSGLTISGIVCPETEPGRKNRQKSRHKEKRNKTGNEVAKNLDCTLADASKPAVVVDLVTNEEVLQECINTGNGHMCFFKDESVEIYKNLNTSTFSTGKLILKPLKEKGHQFVHMDTIVFHVIHGKIVVTLHKTSYYLTSGAFFYVPAGNGYNIRNLLNEESVLLFTQLKNDRPIVTSTLLEPSSP